MALLGVAHLADDVNQSFIPALLPYLVLQWGISHTTAGTLVLCQAISSSVVQPAIGHEKTLVVGSIFDASDSRTKRNTTSLNTRGFSHIGTCVARRMISSRAFGISSSISFA